MFSAVPFAESGEFEAARDIAAGSKKVLLVLTGRETDTKSLKCALNIAIRNDAGLEVLANSNSDETRNVLELAEKEARRESVGLKVTWRDGCVRESLFAYTKNRRDLLCVVIESTDALNIDCSREEKKLEGIWEKLGCPLALVSEKTD